MHAGGEPWTRDIKKPKKRKVKQAQDLQEDEVADEPVILGTGAAHRGILLSMKSWHTWSMMAALEHAAAVA